MAPCQRIMAVSEGKNELRCQREQREPCQPWMAPEGPHHRFLTQRYSITCGDRWFVNHLRRIAKGREAKLPLGNWLRAFAFFAYGSSRRFSPDAARDLRACAALGSLGGERAARQRRASACPVDSAGILHRNRHLQRMTGSGHSRRMPKVRCQGIPDEDPVVLTLSPERMKLLSALVFPEGSCSVEEGGRGEPRR